MKWKSQSTHKVGEKYDPLMGFQSWSDLPFVRQPVPMSAAKYPAALSFAICSSFTVEATHLPPAPDMFGCAEKA